MSFLKKFIGKKVLIILCIAVFALTNTSFSFAADSSTNQIRVWGVSDYPWYCNYDDITRVVDLSNEVVNTFPSTWTRVKTMETSASRSSILSYINNYDCSFFIGHGPSDPYRLHLTANHPSSLPRLQCNDSANNIYRSDLKLGGELDYMHFHTCNYLRASNTTEKTQVFNMMNGLHIALGYGSTMWMYPGQMKDYVTRLNNLERVKDAWINAAKIYQPLAKPSVNVIGVVVAHKNTLYHTIEGRNSTDPPSYANDPSNYSYTTYTVAYAQ